MDEPPPPPPSIHPNRLAGVAFAIVGSHALKKRSNANEQITHIGQTDDKSPKTVQKRMELFGKIQMYKPTAEECLKLNIPDDRLDIHSVQSILSLCGGFKGIRFSSDELKDWSRRTFTMKQIFMELERKFNSMSSKSKKIEASHIDSPDSAFDPSDVEVAREFHTLAESYWQNFCELQAQIKNKQEILATGSGEDVKIEKDPDSCGHRYPRWLDTLMSKYEAFAATSPKSKQLRPLTHGKLAAFISCCMMKELYKIENSDEEVCAISELLQASNDSVLQFNDAGEEQSFQPSAATRSQGYWEDRIYAFVSKLAELKSMRNDEKSLRQYELFVSAPES